ncbi:glycosyltransferase [Bacillus suaedae]|uniref:Glycosyltransferase n=1 Tax=Halalkalibacter suaedae TaxID=2822140 RepID=A0A940WYJ8_9BACI|nr:glycosyltransferase [Bacillus suaedae]MBP3953152.1 glycosyltransferase [Bacillus suaedae]
MKNIAFLVSSAATGGGIQKSLSIIAKALNNEKFSVTIISLFQFEETKYDFGPETIFLKGSLKGNVDLKKVFLKTYFECKRLLSSANFTTLVVEGVGLVPFIPKKFLKDKSIKVIVRDHTGLSNYSRFGLSWLGLKHTIRYSDKFVVLTEENEREYAEIFKDKKSKIKTIPNALDPNIIESSYNSDSKKVLFVGRLSYEKGADLLVESFGRVLNLISDDDWRLDIFGSGPEMVNIKNQISKQNLKTYINLKGYKENIYSIYNEYAFLVVPSRFESFGLIIIEALKVGIPVIAFDCNYGPRSILRDNENGLLVQKNNISQFSNAISKLILNKDLRIYLSNNTNNNLEKYNYRNVISEWEILL